MRFTIAYSSILFLLAATVGTAQPVPVHEYLLNGSYADTQGGPDITPEGGSLVGNLYIFGARQGLTLQNPGLTSPGEYTIEMSLRIDDLNAISDRGWVKLIDFFDLAADDGLYNYNGQLQFWPHTAVAANIVEGAFFHVVVTRDGTTGEVIAYTDGGSELNFIDSGGSGIFAATNNVIRFLQDDDTTQFGPEDSPGAIEFIRIFDQVLTPVEVTDLATAVPVELMSFTLE